jgi:hypothetical protein
MRTSLVDVRVHAPRPWAGPFIVTALLGLMALWSTSRIVANATRHEVAPSPPATSAPLGQVWVGTDKTAELLAGLDAETVRTFLGGSNSFALGGWSAASIPSQAWASEAQFASDLATGRIASDVRLVMYDPESWSATPPDERLDPETAMRAFASLAHRHGYLVMITPHPNLTSVPGAACVAVGVETEAHAFLRCGIEAAAARFADIVEVQAQSLEVNVMAYHHLVAAAAVQARAANPRVLVLSGLSTNFTQDPAVLYAAWRSVLGVVDGHYLNVPHGVRPEVAVGFLQMAANAAGDLALHTEAM